MEVAVTIGKNPDYRTDYVPSRSINKCYQCKYNGHTVHNCPLSLCTHCSKFGHLYSSCPARQNRKIIETKSESQTTFANSLPALPPIPSHFTQKK